MGCEEFGYRVVDRKCCSCKANHNTYHMLLSHYIPRLGD